MSDTGVIESKEGKGWQVRVDDVRQPVGGVVTHLGEVVKGKLGEGDAVNASIDGERRMEIMRNHTATHLLHRTLRSTLGDHVRQKGSLVAPDRLRFDYSHKAALTPDEMDTISVEVNRAILANYAVTVEFKSREEAESEGAMALFGEKYDAEVRTINIWDVEQRYSYELCGGNHLSQTAEIGPFVIVREEASGRRGAAYYGADGPCRAGSHSAAIQNTVQSSSNPEIRSDAHRRGCAAFARGIAENST